MNGSDDALALVARIRSGSITAGAAAKAALERAEARTALGAVRFLDAEPASRQAEAIDVGPSRRNGSIDDGPVLGVPFPTKDIGAGAAGLPLTCGSAPMADAPRALVAVSHGMWRLCDSVDVLLTPMLTMPPPLLGSVPTDGEDVEARWRRMHAFAAYACLAIVAGVPALSVQVVGPMGSDGLLLRLARRLEAARPWTVPAPAAGLAA